MHVNDWHFIICNSLKTRCHAAVELVARFQANPKEAHVLAIKRIFRYLKGTLEFGLWFPKGHKLTLVAYTDRDWEGSIDD